MFCCLPESFTNHHIGLMENNELVSDEDIKKAIMNFSFYLTVGNMDEAYNSVRNIKNNTVW
jgi:hypothetical protein